MKRVSDLRLARRAGLALMLAAAAFVARAEESAGPKTQEASLEIAQASELAGKGSDQVKAKLAVAEAALRAVDEARASFLPALSASVSGAYLVNPPKGVSVKAGALGALPGPTGPILLPQTDFMVAPDAKDSYFKGNLTFTQPIFTWGKISAAVDLASLESKVAAIGGEAAALDAVRSANRAYFSAIVSGEGAAILEELRGLAASILEDRQAALNEGLATRADVLSSAADLASLEAKLAQAREGESTARESLGILIGLDCSSIRLVSDFRDSLPPLAEASLKDGALDSSTDLAAARTRLSEAKRKLDLERGSSVLLPDLSFFASLDVSGQDIPLSSGGWTKTWNWDLSLGIAAKADLFDGGASAARTREASSSLEAARIGALAAEKAARFGVRRAIDAARGAEAAVREKEARAAWAAEVLRGMSAKAADQAASRPELNAAAIGEASARLELLYSRYALEEAIADLELASGRAFDGPSAEEGGK